MKHETEENPHVDFDNKLVLEEDEHIELTQATRKAMGADACAWYDALTPENHVMLRNAYIDKIVPKMGGQVSFEAWILMESKLACKFKGKEDRALRNTQRLMKRQGLR